MYVLLTVRNAFVGCLSLGFQQPLPSVTHGVFRVPPARALRSVLMRLKFVTGFVHLGIGAACCFH